MSEPTKQYTESQNKYTPQTRQIKIKGVNPSWNECNLHTSQNERGNRDLPKDLMIHKHYDLKTWHDCFWRQMMTSHTSSSHDVIISSGPEIIHPNVKYCKMLTKHFWPEYLVWFFFDKHVLTKGYGSKPLKIAVFVVFQILVRKIHIKHNDVIKLL